MTKEADPPISTSYTAQLGPQPMSEKLSTRSGRKRKAWDASPRVRAAVNHVSP